MNGYRVCMTLVYCRFDKYLVQKWVHVYANYTRRTRRKLSTTYVVFVEILQKMTELQRCKRPNIFAVGTCTCRSQ